MSDYEGSDQQIEFKRTGNPLFVWDRILECRKENEPLPTWVLDYLEDVAETIVNLKPQKNKLASDVRDALKFKGKPFDEYKSFLRRGGKAVLFFYTEIYLRVQNGLLKDGAMKKAVYTDVGERCFKNDGNPNGRANRVMRIHNHMEKWIKKEESK